MDPLKEKLLEKCAGNKWEAIKNISQPFLRGLAMASAMAALGGGITVMQQWISKKQKDPAFKRMLEIHPELEQENKEDVLKYFNSLYHFAPSMAKDPLAAGAYIRQTLRMATHGGPTIDTIKTVSDIENSRASAKYSPTQSLYMDQLIESTKPVPEKIYLDKETLREAFNESINTGVLKGMI